MTALGSVSVALTILSLFKTWAAIGVTEAATHLGISRSTTHRRHCQVNLRQAERWLGSNFFAQSGFSSHARLLLPNLERSCPGFPISFGNREMPA
jgi:hypothetical protein